MINRILVVVIFVSIMITVGMTILFVSGEISEFGRQQILASEQIMLEGNSGIAQMGHYTVHLPLAMRHYDPAYVFPFGYISYGSVNDATGLSQMKTAGARWVTTSFSWAAVESTPDSYDWSSFDLTAQNAQAAGMDVFVLFTGNPSWAAELPGGPVDDNQDLVEFVSDMVERYDCDGREDAPGSPCVHYWSFYAEPENGDLGRAEKGKGCWGDKENQYPACGDGADYAEMLSQIAPAMHAASPQAKVLIGGLAYDYFQEDGGPYLRSFLADTLSALNEYPSGAMSYIDAVAFHYYPISPEWATIREKTAEIQGIMEDYGVETLPLICPEMGYWSSPNHGSSEERQAQRVVQMFTRGLSKDILFFSWYKVFDRAEAGSPEDLYPDRTSGLLDVNKDPKPSYYAYQTMTRELSGARYLRELETTNVEGYVFRMPSGYEKTVLWAKEGQVSANVTFPYVCLRGVGLDGTVYEPILDGDSYWDHDGTVNGQILFAVYDNAPFYVQPCE